MKTLVYLLCFSSPTKKLLLNSLTHSAWMYTQCPSLRIQLRIKLGMPVTNLHKWKRTASNLSLLSHSPISNFTQFKITLIVTLTSCDYWHWCDTVGDWWIVARRRKAISPCTHVHSSTYGMTAWWLHENGCLKLAGCPARRKEHNYVLSTKQQTYQRCGSLMCISGGEWRL